MDTQLCCLCGILRMKPLLPVSSPNELCAHNRQRAFYWNTDHAMIWETVVSPASIRAGYNRFDSNAAILAFTYLVCHMREKEALYRSSFIVYYFEHVIYASAPLRPIQWNRQNLITSHHSLHHLRISLYTLYLHFRHSCVRFNFSIRSNRICGWITHTFRFYVVSFIVHTKHMNDIRSMGKKRGSRPEMEIKQWKTGSTDNAYYHQSDNEQFSYNMECC